MVVLVTRLHYFDYYCSMRSRRPVTRRANCLAHCEHQFSVSQILHPRWLFTPPHSNFMLCFDKSTTEIVRPVDTVIRRDFRLRINSLIFYSNLFLNILYFWKLSLYFLWDSVKTPTEEFYPFHSWRRTCLSQLNCHWALYLWMWNWFSPIFYFFRSRLQL